MKKTVLSLALSALLANTALVAKENYGDVNGQKITQTDIAMVIQNPSVDFNTLPKDTQDKILNQIVDTKLLTAEALKREIVKSPEFEAKLQNLKENLALQYWMQDSMKTISLSDQEVDDFYTKNKDKFADMTQYKARHILVKTEDEAKKIIATLTKSKAPAEDFSKIAKEKTLDPSGKTNGGDLGWFEAGKMVPEFANVIKSLPHKAFTKTPVKTPYGFHVILLEDSKPVDKATVKQIASRDVFNQKINAKIEELRKTAKIILP